MVALFVLSRFVRRRSHKPETQAVAAHRPARLSTGTNYLQWLEVSLFLQQQAFGRDLSRWLSK